MKKQPYGQSIALSATINPTTTMKQVYANILHDCIMWAVATLVVGACIIAIVLIPLHTELDQETWDLESKTVWGTMRKIRAYKEHAQEEAEFQRRVRDEKPAIDALFEQAEAKEGQAK